MKYQILKDHWPPAAGPSLLCHARNAILMKSHAGGRTWYWPARPGLKPQPFAFRPGPLR